jgi:hypothetical protein
VELVGDAVAAVHVAGEARNLERLAAIVALEQRHGRRGRPARFHEPPEAVRRVQATNSRPAASWYPSTSLTVARSGTMRSGTRLGWQEPASDAGARNG